jgi:hypothetical protein
VASSDDEDEERAALNDARDRAEARDPGDRALLEHETHRLNARLERALKENES